MSKHGSAAVALSGMALAGLVLAGCSGSVPNGAKPQVTSNSAGSGTNTGSTSPATAPQISPTSSANPTGTGQNGGNSIGSATHSEAAVIRPGVASKSFAKANSIPFPVAVGNTWVYRTEAGGAAGRTTNRIVAAGPGSAGYLVTMSSATTPAGAGSDSAGTAGYTFYPDGTIGYPAPAVSGLAVTGGGIRWPNAAALASGHAYHSTLQLQVGGTQESAGVNVYGAGTETVTVPAGTYQASVVETTIAAKGETIVVTTWIAPGVGTVKTQIQVTGAGTAGLTTYELLSFTKAKSAIGDGS